MYLKEDVIVKQEIKKSRFIGILTRVKSIEDFKAFIAKLKKEYPQATHYCSACKIGNTTHSSDDGEPAGTAGRPMLDVLLGHQADEIGAVVIRYFGGTLLGKGGLVRAYSSTTALALEEAEFLEAQLLGLYELSTDYGLAGRVEAALRTLGVEDLQVSYGQQALFTFLFSEDPNTFLSQKFSGQVQAKLLQECQLER